MIRTAETSRNIEELAQLYQYAERTGFKRLMEVSEERAYSLGFHHADIERKYDNPLRKNLWPFSDAKKHGAIPAHGGLAKFAPGTTKKPVRVSASSYKGYKIARTEDGEWFSTLDPDSWYETSAQVKRAIDSYIKGRSNPSKFDRCVKEVQARGGAANAYAVCTAARTRNPVTLVPLGLYDVQTLDTVGKGIYKGLKRSKRGNPGEISDSESVERSYELFHGRPAGETIYEDKDMYLGPAKMWSVGDLIKIKLRAPNGDIVTLKDFESPDGSACHLTANRGGTQLYVRKGDQRVDLEEFDIGAPYHDKEDLGEVLMIWYFTTKDHLGSEGGEANYYHRLGEEHAIRPVKTSYEFGKIKTRRVPRPRLAYDTRNVELEFIGGEYIVEVEGIRN